MKVRAGRRVRVQHGRHLALVVPYIERHALHLAVVVRRHDEYITMHNLGVYEGGGGGFKPLKARWGQLQSEKLL
jgi:hypothetical protein